MIMAVKTRLPLQTKSLFYRVRRTSGNKKRLIKSYLQKVMHYQNNQPFQLLPSINALASFFQASNTDILNELQNFQNKKLRYVIFNYTSPVLVWRD